MVTILPWGKIPLLARGIAEGVWKCHNILKIRGRKGQKKHPPSRQRR